MKAVDIPQADSLSRIRELVQTVQFGATDTTRLQRVMTLHPRHVGYHLHAARILKWLEKEGDHWKLTSLAEKLLSTNAGSQEERALFRKSISQSETLRELAPNLLGDEEPEQDLLALRIQEVAGIAAATCRRRASTMLRWRTQSMPSRPRRIDSYAADDDDPNSGLMRVHAIEAERFGLLRSARLEATGNPVLIGENATGKSTLCDVLGFLGDALREGVQAAVQKRCAEIDEMLWFGEGEAFALAVEFTIPKAARFDHARARYEVEVGKLEDGRMGIRRESLYLTRRDTQITETVQQSTPRGWRKILGMSQQGQARFGSENSGSRKTTTAPLDGQTLALARLPDDGERFPAALRLRSLLMFGVHNLTRLADDEGDFVSLLFPDEHGSLAVLVGKFAAQKPDEYRTWVAHVTESIPSIEQFDLIEADGETSLVLVLKGGLRLPVGRAASGVIKTIALTLLAHFGKGDRIFLVDEPEAGIHPISIGPLAQSLASASNVQFLITTYSPQWLAAVSLDSVRCFVREAGGVRVVPGSQIELLEDETNHEKAPQFFSVGLLG